MPRLPNANDLVASGLGPASASLGAAAPYAGPAMAKWSNVRDRAIVNSLGRPARIFCAGDSKTMGAGAGTGATRYLVGAAARSRPAVLARLLTAAGLTAYYGFSGYNGTTTPAERMDYDPRVQLTNTGGGVRGLSGTITASGTGTFLSYTQGGAVDRFSVLTQWDATRIPFTVTKGAESFTLTPVGATANVGSRQEVVFATKDAAAIVLARPAGGATTSIIAGVAWDSANPGVEVINAGNFGITAATTVTAQNGTGMDYLPLLALYAPDLTIINLGTNDVPDSSGITLDTYIASIAALGDTAAVSGSVLVTWPAIGGVAPANGSDAKRAQWKAALKALCDNRQWLFLDEETLLGGRVAAQAAGAFADGVHEMPWTYYRQAAGLSRVIMSV